MHVHVPGREGVDTGGRRGKTHKDMLSEVMGQDALAELIQAHTWASHGLRKGVSLGEPRNGTVIVGTKGSISLRSHFCVSVTVFGAFCSSLSLVFPPLLGTFSSVRCCGELRLDGKLTSCSLI